MSKNNGINSRNSKDEVVKTALESLKSQDISYEDVLKYLKRHKEDVIQVPVSIFKIGLSPLQAVVKYLADKGYSYSEISKRINRDPRTVWNTHRIASGRYSGIIVADETRYSIDLEMFKDRKLSFLEHLCDFLKGEYNLRYSQIANLIGKDARTIWTVCKRAEKKKNEGK